MAGTRIVEVHDPVRFAFLEPEEPTRAGRLSVRSLTVEPPLQAEHFVVELQQLVVVACDHQSGVRVLAGAEHRLRADAAVLGALVAEALEEHLSVERLDHHHLAHAHHRSANGRGAPLPETSPMTARIGSIKRIGRP